MKVLIENSGNTNEITLTNSNYISSGGEGAVYKRNGWAYKIYANPDKALPRAKLAELSILQLENIIKPKSMVLNKDHIIIGYMMKYIPKSVSLCQLFTRSFKDRNGIDPEKTLDIINSLRDGIKHCHDNGILIVDVNELNFLVKDKTFNEVYFIDVDSYQTPTYKATAIMDSIRDRHTTDWSTGTDWFSFGILAFQLFIGIHPYKGKHPKYKGIDQRMLENISVFNKDVKLPGAAMPLDVIPDIYKAWFKSIFDSGNRLAPPFENIDTIIVSAQIREIEGTDNFIIELLQSYDTPIVDVDDNIVLTTEGLHLSHMFTLDKEVKTYAQIAKPPGNNYVLAATADMNLLKLYNVSTGKYLQMEDIWVDQVMSYNNILYIKSGETIFELDFINIKEDTTLFGLYPLCNVLPEATHIFPGVIIQELLGAYYVSIFPKAKTHIQTRMKELSGYRIIDAKYESNVLIILAENTKNKKYDNIIIKFSPKLNDYSVRIIEDVDYSNINFTVLDNGICVYMNHENHVELFFNKKDSNDVKIIKDMVLAGGKFFHDGNTTLLARAEKLYKIKMK